MIWRAEWIKFRTVRGWPAGLAASALIVVALGVLFATGSRMSCMNGDQEITCPTPPANADGVAVQDRFAFTHRSLSGDGEITAKVGGIDSTITYPPPNHDRIVSGTLAWSKAGLMIKDGTEQGADYAAVLLTGARGVRMQSGFTEDQAAPGFATAKEAWLRLTRAGEQITAWASADGAAWQKIDTVRLKGLPDTVQIGLFVTSPGGLTVDEKPEGGHVVAVRFTQTTAEFSQVSPGGGWTDTLVGYTGYRTDWEKGHPPGHTETGGVITVAGSGDIAPQNQSEGLAVERVLTGVFAGLLPLIVVAALWGAAEFRHRMIASTLVAMPHPVRVSVAKAGVVAAASLVAGLVAVAVAMPVTLRLMAANGVVMLPTPVLTTVRVAVGTAPLLALAGVLAYGMGSLLRRAVPAVVAVTALLIAPPILAVTSVLPTEAGAWLLRLTPGAAFAIQQSIPAYPQLSTPQTVFDGYFPLAPWAGLAVLALYALTAVAAATWRLRRSVA